MEYHLTKCYELLIYATKCLNLKKTLCCVKEAKKKTPHNSRFHLCKVFEQAKLRYGDRNQNSVCLWRQKELTRKGHWGCSGHRDVLHLDQDGGYTRNTSVKT